MTEDWKHDTFPRAIEDYTIVSFEATDELSRENILRADQIQGEDYVRSGYIEPVKLDDQGRILDLKDEKRDVMYVVARHNDEGVDAIEGSLKVIRPPFGQGLESLAAYEYAEDILYPEFKEQLLEAHRANPKGGVVEIGALSRIEQPKSHFVSYELIREIMQRAVRDETNEKWFITFTEKAFKPIRAAFGPRVIQVAGDTVVIDEPDEHVRLIPSVIEPCKLIDNLARTVLEEQDEGRRTMLSTTLLLMVDGLHASEISDDARLVINAERVEIVI